MVKQKDSRQTAFPEAALNQVRAGATLAFLKRTSQAYRLTGKVVEGNKIGRTLGYPTANMQLENPTEVVPGQGVYTAMVSMNDHWFQSMVNVGIRPTLDMYNVTIEAHLFGFQGDIYGKTFTIHFLERIRDEMRFSSLSELKEQLDRDREKSRKSLTKMEARLLKGEGELLLKTA